MTRGLAERKDVVGGSRVGTGAWGLAWMDIGMNLNSEDVAAAREEYVRQTLEMYPEEEMNIDVG